MRSASYDPWMYLGLPRLRRLRHNLCRLFDCHSAPRITRRECRPGSTTISLGVRRYSDRVCPCSSGASRLRQPPLGRGPPLYSTRDPHHLKRDWPKERGRVACGRIVEHLAARCNGWARIGEVSRLLSVLVSNSLHFHNHSSQV